jgi:hypothetical protein
MCNFSRIVQAKNYVIEDMDMCIKVKQLGINMWEQMTIVFRPFFDFMDVFKVSKANI